MHWFVAAARPFPFLDLRTDELVLIEPRHATPLRVIGPDARPLPTNYGAICGGLIEGALVCLTEAEAVALLAIRQPPPQPFRHLHLVA